MSYTKIGPFTNSFGPPYLDAGFFNSLEAAVGGATSGCAYLTGTGSAATDQPALTAAITAAQAAQQDLVLSGNFTLTAGISWNLARGSLTTIGHVRLDFSALTSGVALTITGDNGDSSRGPHLPILHTVSGFQMVGPNTDASTVDGILFTDTSEGIDQGTLAHVMVYGFRDGLTYGSNVWSIEHYKVGVANCHRYGINLSVAGSNSGECITFTHVSVYGCHNASNTAVAVYSPSVGNAEARFIGGSLDYNDSEGLLQGGTITFFGTHIEDNQTGPMFKYAAVSAGQLTTVNFDGCFWDVVGSTARDHVHEITTATTAPSNLTVNFVGGAVGVGSSQGTTWLVNNAASGSAGSLARFGGGFTGTTNGLLLGDFYNMLNNGYFDDSTAFVTGGVNGWTAGTTGTWSIGTSGARSGNALTLTGTGTGTSVTYQKIVLPPQRTPLRLGGWVSIPSFTSGAAGIFVQFYAVDGTTTVGGQFRVGHLTAASGWTALTARFTPPRGAFYAQVQLVNENLVGTAVFDGIEAVAI